MQIKLQLERLVPVHKVHDLTAEGKSLERELALIKVGGHRATPRAEALRLADAFRAQIVDATTESFVFEVTGKPSQDRQLHRADGAARAGRSGAHRARRDLARRRKGCSVQRHGPPCGSAKPCRMGGVIQTCC